jgi:hypothetical protein
MAADHQVARPAAGKMAVDRHRVGKTAAPAVQTAVGIQESACLEAGSRAVDSRAVESLVAEDFQAAEIQAVEIPAAEIPAVESLVEGNLVADCPAAEIQAVEIPVAGTRPVVGRRAPACSHTAGMAHKLDNSAESILADTADTPLVAFQVDRVCNNNRSHSQLHG